MEQALQTLNEKYDPDIAVAQQSLNDAQMTLSMIQGHKAEKYKEIFAYYDAISKKIEVDMIVNRGKPII